MTQCLKMSFAIVLALLPLVACGRQAGPTAPSAVVAPIEGVTGDAFGATVAGPTGSSATTADGAVDGGPTADAPRVFPPASDRSAPLDVLFPSRSEAMLFRTALESKYRDGLRRNSVLTFVDQEGTVVWTLEYLRYRVNLCSHTDAVLRVMRQIDGFGVQPVCGTTNTAVFPPRNEPFDFMIQLEAKYRDGLRRGAGPTFVDVEGNIVWTQEYLRYRVSGCNHLGAQDRVFTQIDGRGVPAGCAPVTTTPTPTPTTPGGTGAFVRWATNSTTCRCWLSPISLYVDGAFVGSMSCSGTQTVSVSPGTRTLRSCDAEACLTSTATVTAGATHTLTLVCTGTSSSGLNKECVAADPLRP
jgi:hypothetical protein